MNLEFPSPMTEYERGKADGYEAGYEDGQDAGYVKGRGEGYEQGYQEASDMFEAGEVLEPEHAEEEEEVIGGGEFIEYDQNDEPYVLDEYDMAQDDGYEEYIVDMGTEDGQ